MAQTHWTEEESVARGLEYGKWAELKAMLGSNLREAGQLAWTIVRDPRALALVLLGMTVSFGVLPAEASGNIGSQLNSSAIMINNLDTDANSLNIDAISPLETISYDVDQDSINAERIARIQFVQAQLEAFPSLWDAAPEACKNSMVRMELYGGNDQNSGGSASVIDSRSLYDLYGGEFLVHTMLVSDHVMRDANGNVIEGRAIIYPGSYSQDQRFAFNTASYTQLVADDGSLLDEGVLIVYGQGSWGDMREVGLVPLGIDNVRGIDNVNQSGILHTFDYPGITNIPQFTTTQMGESIFDSKGDQTQILVPLPGSSTIWKGSSGGAVCTPDGEHRGVIKNIPPMDAYGIGIEGNPGNIQAQIMDAIFEAKNDLENVFGSLSED